jgi:long-chain acyl-CoA synthetase
MEVVIVDDCGDMVPRGVIGKNAIRSAGVSPGYWNKEADGLGAVACMSVCVVSNL